MVSGWPLFLRSTRTFTRTIPSDAGITEHDILRVVLHSPRTLCTLSPLVTKSEVLDPVTHPNLYTNHEDIRLLGVKLDIMCTADCTLTDDGVNVEVHAGLGTILKQIWRVATNADSGEIEVSETVDCRSLFLLHPYIVGTFSKAHSSVFDRMVDKVKEDVKATQD